MVRRTQPATGERTALTGESAAVARGTWTDLPPAGRGMEVRLPESRHALAAALLLRPVRAAATSRSPVLSMGIDSRDSTFQPHSTFWMDSPGRRMEKRNPPLISGESDPTPCGSMRYTNRYAIDPPVHLLPGS